MQLHKVITQQKKIIYFWKLIPCLHALSKFLGVWTKYAVGLGSAQLDIKELLSPPLKCTQQAMREKEKVFLRQSTY